MVIATDWIVHFLPRLFVCFTILPATEGRSLEEIERHYSDSRKTLADRKISPMTEEHAETQMRKLARQNSNCVL